jgi:hypothetical protein
MMKRTCFCVEEVNTTDISEEYAASIKKGKASRVAPLLAGCFFGLLFHSKDGGRMFLQIIYELLHGITSEKTVMITVVP